MRDERAQNTKKCSTTWSSAKLTKITRNANFEKNGGKAHCMDTGIDLKKVASGASAIRKQALIIHAKLQKKNLCSESFSASKDCFDKFRKRYSLHNVAFSGESASADHEAARKFPDQLRE